MDQLVALARTLAVLAVLLAGICTIVGASATRGVLLRFAAGVFLLSLFVPYALAAVGQVAAGSGVPTVSPGALLAVIAGHVALGGFLVARRLRGRGPSDIERSRGRERPRLPPGE